MLLIIIFASTPFSQLPKTVQTIIIKLKYYIELSIRMIFIQV